MNFNLQITLQSGINPRPEHRIRRSFQIPCLTPSFPIFSNPESNTKVSIEKKQIWPWNNLENDLQDHIQGHRDMLAQNLKCNEQTELPIRRLKKK